MSIIQATNSNSISPRFKSCDTFSLDIGVKYVNVITQLSCDKSLVVSIKYLFTSLFLMSNVISLDYHNAHDRQRHS